MANYSGTSGNDTIIGTANDDLFIDSAGTDSIDGGGGQDTYQALNAGSFAYTFIGTEGNDESGLSAVSAGDVDGDGLDDVFISGFRADDGASDGGEAYLITAADLAAADAADGTTDGVIDLDNVNEQSTSYQFIGDEAGNWFGTDVSSAGDVDGDDRDDLIFGEYRGDDGGLSSGGSYLLTAADLADADAADGTTDGVIVSSNIGSQSTSYKFVGIDTFDQAGSAVSSAGDVDGDGLDDLLIGASQADSNGVSGSGETYLITAADLADADAADGTTDGVIDLDNVNEQSTSYQFITANSSSFLGASLASAGDVDGDSKDDLILTTHHADGAAVDSGLSYLVTAADLADADAADGTTDGVIDLDNVSQQSTSYEFVGANAGDQLGFSVDSAGDVDGDSLDDLIISAYHADGGGLNSGGSYLITAADLAAADAADGTTDGVISMDNVKDQSTSYEFVGEEAGDNAGISVSSAGDVDGDGKDDLIIGANWGDDGGSDYAGTSYLITAADLAAADAADGTTDGVIDLGNVSQQSSSYQFDGAAAYDYAGASVSSAGDVDGDGKDDLIIGATGADGGGSQSGESYLMTAASLAALDAADGTTDGIIGLENAVITPPPTSGTMAVNLDDAGDGSAVSAGETNTLTSIENVVAGIGPGTDSITLNTTVTNSSAIQGLDTTNAVGTFTGTYLGVAGTYSFGPGGPTLNDILNSPSDGTVNITSGDQAAQIGNISFENFEEINFDFESALDYIVEGTGGDDIINGSYTGDPEGDMVDSNDSLAGDNDDVIEAYGGDDVIFCSDGDDSIDGGTGTDTYQTSPPAAGFAYTFVGTEAYDHAYNITSAGDVDGDGYDDILIGALQADDGGNAAGEAYLITAHDLVAADAADGVVDGVVDLDNVNEQSTSYQFIGANDWDQVSDVASVGDIDGDGLDDLLIGASGLDTTGSNHGGAYLVMSADLADADAADGTTDGVIDLENVSQQAASYSFYGSASLAGQAVSAAGDVDGDGVVDLLISAGQSVGGPAIGGATYLISGADLAALDGQDGTTDGAIDLDIANQIPGSYQFVGIDSQDESGFAISSAGDVDGDGDADLIIGARYADAGGNLSGESYLITSADLADADAADGTTDGVIDLENVSDQSTSYMFVGTEAGDSAGYSVSTIGDMDGDGNNELIISARIADGNGNASGEVYLINSADLADADAADGTTDGVIDLDNVNEQTTSYQFIGGGANDEAGWAVSSAGDFDGDDIEDLLIGAVGVDLGGNNVGATYLISAADLIDADAADGTTDGVIDLENVYDQPGSYHFAGISASDEAGIAVSAAGDVDGDGLDDFLIGARGDDGGYNSGESYLITAASLAEFNPIYAHIDGLYSLSSAKLPAEYGTKDVTLDDLGDGSAIKSGGGTDTLISIENVVAGEGAGNDSITLSTDVSDRSTIQNLDTTNAVGTFTGTYLGVNGTHSFGPGGPTLDDILNDADSSGTVSITSGDEDAQIGNISFENFEEINFNIVCFARGTRIRTEQGETPVEYLAKGDMVKTLDHGLQPIRWIGNRTVPAKRNMAPIMIKAGALGNKSDLRVSPQHRMLITDWRAELMFGESEVLVAAKHLVNGDTIYVEEGGAVEYFHILFDQHEIVWAENALSESFHPGEQGADAIDAEQCEELYSIFPELRIGMENYGDASRMSLRAYEAKLLN